MAEIVERQVGVEFRLVAGSLKAPHGGVAMSERPARPRGEDRLLVPRVRRRETQTEQHVADQDESREAAARRPCGSPPALVRPEPLPLNTQQGRVSVVASVEVL